jgi:5'-methylthioadenosine phosphorylase
VWADVPPHAKEVIRSVAPSIPVERSCACRNALANAIITNREAIPEGVRQDLAPLVRKYLG